MITANYAPLDIVVAEDFLGGTATILVLSREMIKGRRGFDGVAIPADSDPAARADWVRRARSGQLVADVWRYDYQISRVL